MTPTVGLILLLCDPLSLAFVLFVFVDEISRSYDLETAKDNHGDRGLWVVGR